MDCTRVTLLCVVYTGLTLNYVLINYFVLVADNILSYELGLEYDIIYLYIGW